MVVVTLLTIFIKHGASKVYGLDLSLTQNELAKQTNQQAIQQGTVHLFEQPMEEKILLPELVDTVFSIYGLGWTVDIEAGTEKHQFLS